MLAGTPGRGCPRARHLGILLAGAPSEALRCGRARWGHLLGAGLQEERTQSHRHNLVKPLAHPAPATPD